MVSFLLIISEGVVQYEAVIEHKDTMQDTKMLLEQVNVHLHGNNLIENLKFTFLKISNILAGSRLAINASFVFIEPLVTSK